MLPRPFLLFLECFPDDDDGQLLGFDVDEERLFLVELVSLIELFPSERFVIFPDLPFPLELYLLYE